MALNSRPSRFDFYQPGQFQGPDWNRGPLFEQLARDDPEGYFGYVIGQQGGLGTGVDDDFRRSLYSRLQQGYQASKFDQPDLDWIDYLDKYQGRMRDMTQSFDPASRGVRSNQYVGGARRLPRSQ